MSTVYIQRQNDYEENELRALLKKGLQECGIWDKLPGLKVMVKPNLTSSSPPEYARTTHPLMVKVVCDLLKESKVEAFSIAESSAVGIDTMEAWETAGFGPLTADYPFIDLKGKEEVRVPVEGELFKEISFFQETFEYDLIISLAKLKTIFACEVSLACKNMKGLLPDHEKKRFHWEGIHQGVAELLSVLPPTIAIIDGIWGLSLQEKRDSGVVLVGDNLLSTDAVGAKLIGINPEEVDHLKRAESIGIGDISLEKIAIKGLGIKEMEIETFQTAAGVEDIEKIYGIPVFAGTTCSGCVGMLKMALQEVSEKEKALKGLSLALGTDLCPGAVNRETVIIGNCAVKLRGFPYFVPGCPPEKINILDAIERVEKEGKS